MKYALYLLTVLLMLPGCQKNGLRSYEGMWIYESSQPDLGAAYEGSWVKVSDVMDYAFYDSCTDSRFSGKSSDMSHNGLDVTLHASNGNEERVYNVSLVRLKEGVMVVDTDSVNGIMTTIRFVRKQ